MHKFKMIPKVYCFFLNLSLLTLFLFKHLNAENDTTIQRSPKVLEFFSPFLLGGVGIVRFENGLCTASPGTEGTCYTKRLCARVDGIGSTSCARGIGVCCVIQRTCGGSSQVNNTYFVSPGFPTTYNDASTCTFRIIKIDDNVCQVRLDFLTLRLAQPNDNGTCTTDALIITGGASNVPILCGDNTGQHVYVDFNGDSDIVITVSTAGVGTTASGWNIKATQINCNCPYKAPSGCLQYFNSTSGTVRSFNYGTSGLVTGTRQLANMNYGVCVAMINGYCGIRWTAASGNYSFTVSDNTYTNVGDGTIATPAAEMFGTNCTTDFVVIPSPVFDNSTPASFDRFCGNGFAPVTSYTKPFVLTVVTDGNEVNDTGNRGFALNYQQVRCSNAVLLG